VREERILLSFSSSSATRLDASVALNMYLYIRLFFSSECTYTHTHCSSFIGRAERELFPKVCSYLLDSVLGERLSVGVVLIAAESMKITYLKSTFKLNPIGGWNQPSLMHVDRYHKGAKKVRKSRASRKLLALACGRMSEMLFEQFGNVVVFSLVGNIDCSSAVVEGRSNIGIVI